jgi:Fe-S cluster assembly protein SufD
MAFARACSVDEVPYDEALGVTVGRFDDEHLFYLRSRGISEPEARRLVVHGFFNDLVRRIAVPEIEEQLTATVEAELAKNVLKDLVSGGGA